MLVAATFLLGVTSGAPAWATGTGSLGPSTVLDASDVGSRLDIRSVSVASVSSEKTRITIVFWDRVPEWLLRRHAAQVDLAASDATYSFRFWRNDNGVVRMIWGDAGSNCCGSARAEHPNGFTYTSIVRTDGGLAPVPTKFQGLTTRKLRCSGKGRRCLLEGNRPGERIDRTRWGRL